MNAENREDRQKTKVLDSAEESRLITNYFQRYQRAEAAVQHKQQQFKILDQFDRGEQWKDASIPPWVPKPVANWMKYIRTLKRANLASAIPTASYTARIPEQQETINKLAKAYKHVWEVEKIPRTIRRCIDRSLVQGTSVAMVYTDDTYVGGQYYGKQDTSNMLYQGRICVKHFPIGNFYIDPDAYRLQEAKFIDVTENTTLKAVKNNKKFQEYAGAKLKELKGEQLAVSDSESGEIYNRDNTLGMAQSMNVEGDEMVTLHTHWERYVNEKGAWQLDVTQYLSNATWALFRVENFQPTEYPFAVLYDEEEENDFWGTSTAGDIIEMQKIINKTAQTAAIIGSLHQNPQKVVTRSSGINAKELARTGSMPGKVWTTNDGEPSKSIHHTEPPDIPRGLFDLEDRMKNDIREMVGINEAYTGQSVGSLTTSTGVNSLIERSTIRDKDKLIQIDEFVERISDLILLNIMYKWRDKRPITTMGKNGKPEFDTYEPLDMSTIQNLEWICKSDIYAKAPTTQALRKQQADNLMQMQGQFQFDPPLITQEEWLRYQDFDMKDDIAQRIESDRQRMAADAETDMAGLITQVATQLAELLRSGASPDKVQQASQQMASEILAEKEKKKRMAGNQPSNDPAAPQATTGALAMQAMARGS